MIPMNYGNKRFLLNYGFLSFPVEKRERYLGDENQK